MSDDDPPIGETYLFVLEHVPTGAVCGTSGIEVQVIGNGAAGKSSLLSQPTIAGAGPRNRSTISNRRIPRIIADTRMSVFQTWPVRLLDT